MNKKIIVGILALSLTACALAACGDKEKNENKPTNQVISGENIVVEDNATYNNGGLFVQYKGKTYFREYSNADVEGMASGDKYAYQNEEKTTKYMNAISANGKIQNVFEDDGFGEFYILNDRFFLSGYKNKLYSVNMLGKDYVEFCKGEYLGCDEEKGLIYYINENTENAIYALDSKTLKIKKINNDDLEENFYESLGNKPGIDTEDNEIHSDIFSAADEEAFKLKYGVSSGDSNYIVSINNIEEVGNHIYYLIELSKHFENTSVDGEDTYERIVSESYMYDKISKKKTLLYLYKATDKDVMEDENVYGSGELTEFEEPLAENEMYLEIKLEGKGLKDTFDVRVEEVGGLIIGKRVEYEGTHSRNEGILKVKVTREVGAMLTVYIDNKLDSQMLIEE
ncbi:MAG: hypothetical protein J6C46_07975 [Clostridia bacterium]|nr:hypothetical protein [Clostridia bacterium]